MSSAAAAAAGPKRMAYFELLHFNPIKATLSFQSVHGGELPSDGTIAHLLSITTKVMRIENATLRFNCLLLRDPFAPRDEIMSRILRHYNNQLMSQIYRLLGSFDIIGSPVSLVETLGTGVFDFFHEPAEGLVHSPKAFGEGLAKGTMSLINNTVFGIFNTAAKLTGSVTHGIAAISFDDEYIRERELDRQRERPKHAAHGFLLGVKGLGVGFFKGLTGVVEQPVTGAMRGGAEGFVKGVGRGVVGVVIKPVVGVLDLFNKTTEGIRNVTTIADQHSTGSRRRNPRNIAADGVIEPFSREKAEGSFILYQVSPNIRPFSPPHS